MKTPLIKTREAATVVVLVTAVCAGMALATTALVAKELLTSKRKAR